MDRIPIEPVAHRRGSGIRWITPPQASALLALIERHRRFYVRLIDRCRKWHFRDGDTQAVVDAACRVEWPLLDLAWHVRNGAAADTCDPADWRGDGI